MQLIFNKTSGGGNKVKINGLPPAERLNLKEIETSVYRNDLIPIPVKKIILKKGDTHYVLGMDFKLYKFKLGEEATQVCDKDMENIAYKLTYVDEKGALYTAITDKNQSYIEFYKIENGLLTLISQKGSSSFGRSAISPTKAFNLNSEFYFCTYNSNYKVHKSTDFGATLTDITSQIKLSDGARISYLDSLDFSFAKKAYSTKRIGSEPYDVEFYSFDGLNLKKYGIINNISQEVIISDGFNIDDSEVFVMQKKSEFVESSIHHRTKYTYSLIKIEDNNSTLKLNEYKTIDRTTLYLWCGIYGIFAIDNNTVLYAEGEYSDNYIAFPVKTYITE